MTKTNFKKITTRSKITSRGGGVEINCASLGFPGVLMSAYCNYLGGGLLGAVQISCTLKDWQDFDKLVRTSKELKEYFWGLVNPSTEWEGMTFDKNQNMPKSAY